MGKEELGYQKWESESPEEIENKTMESVSADKTEVAVSEIKLTKEMMELNQGEEGIINCLS